MVPLAWEEVFGAFLWCVWFWGEMSLRLAKVEFGTPETGKSRAFRGGALLLVVALHPGRGKKQGVTEVSRYC